MPYSAQTSNLTNTIKAAHRVSVTGMRSPASGTARELATVTPFRVPGRPLWGTQARPTHPTPPPRTKVSFTKHLTIRRRVPESKATSTADALNHHELPHNLSPGFDHAAFHRGVQEDLRRGYEQHRAAKAAKLAAERKARYERSVQQQAIRDRMRAQQRAEYERKLDGVEESVLERVAAAASEDSCNSFDVTAEIEKITRQAYLRDVVFHDWEAEAQRMARVEECKQKWRRIREAEVSRVNQRHWSRLRQIISEERDDLLATNPQRPPPPVERQRSPRLRAFSKARHTSLKAIFDRSEPPETFAMRQEPVSASSPSTIDVDDATLFTHEDWERRLKLAKVGRENRHQQRDLDAEAEETAAEHSNSILGTVKTWACSLWSAVKRTIWG